MTKLNQNQIEARKAVALAEATQAACDAVTCVTGKQRFVDFPSNDEYEAAGYHWNGKRWVHPDE